MCTYRIPVVAAAIVLTLGFGQQALAQAPQSSGGGGIGFGAEFGGTFTHAKGTDVSDVKSKSGLMAGIWFGGNRAGVLGFMGEFTYAEKNVGERGTDSKLKMSYIEIPALFRVNIGAPGKSSPCLYFLAGPVFDFLMKADVDGEDVKDMFNGYDVGVLGGVGFEVLRIGAEVRGNWGLKNLTKDTSGEFSNPDVKAFTLQIVGKIRFN